MFIAVNFCYVYRGNDLLVLIAIQYHSSISHYVFGAHYRTTYHARVTCNISSSFNAWLI